MKTQIWSAAWRDINRTGVALMRLSRRARKRPARNKEQQPIILAELKSCHAYLGECIKLFEGDM